MLRRLGLCCRLHDLRHFMVTQLVAEGVDWRTVSGRAGHADGHMTWPPTPTSQQAQDRQAAEFMESLLATLLHRTPDDEAAVGAGHGRHRWQHSQGGPQGAGLVAHAAGG